MSLPTPPPPPPLCGSSGGSGPSGQAAGWGDRLDGHAKAGLPARGWLGSLLLHLAVLLIAWWWVSPTGLKGDNQGRWLLRIADEAIPTLETMPSVVIAPDLPPAERLAAVDPMAGLPRLDLTPGPVRPTPAATSGMGLEAPAGGGGGGATGRGRDRSSPVDSRRPRGSFFGVEGYGVSFVYIVDMSGSMLGRRFDRAITELIQSVNALRPSQKFGVFMFSDQTVRMFGEAGEVDESSGGKSSLEAANLIPATPVNKVRMARWARSSYRAGHTQPSDAMAAALRLRPSAVFMLSDGKFDPSVDRAGVPLPTVFDLIGDLTRPIPVHCVALEDTGSRVSMERLAKASGGEFHFQRGTAGPAIEATLSQARRDLRAGDRAVAIDSLRRLLAIRPPDRRTLPVEKLFGSEISADFDERLAVGDWPEAAASYVDAWLIRPEAAATERMRARLLAKLPPDDFPAVELLLQTVSLGDMTSQLLSARDRMAEAQLDQLTAHLAARRWPNVAAAARRIDALCFIDPDAGPRRTAWQRVFTALHPGGGELTGEANRVAGDEPPVAADVRPRSRSRGQIRLAGGGGGWLSADRQWLLTQSRVELWRQSGLDRAQEGVSRRAMITALAASLGRQGSKQLQAQLRRLDTRATAGLRRGEAAAAGQDRYVVGQLLRDLAERYAGTTPGMEARRRWWDWTARP